MVRSLCCETWVQMSAKVYYKNDWISVSVNALLDIDVQHCQGLAISHLGLATMEKFPLDIYSHIIEGLDSNQGHEKLLCSHSTCCHQLSLFCQRWIFCTIGFNIWPNNLPKLSRLENTFKNSPHLGFYIHSVKISFQSAMEWKLPPIYCGLTSILSEMDHLEMIDLY